MCGRFAQASEVNRYVQMYGAQVFVGHTPRYNIAPSTDIVVCRLYRGRERELVHLRWGLVPHWTKQPSNAYRTINARAETIAEKPAYRDAFRSRRCLIPADGFFEWKGETSPKQPYFIRRNNGEPLSLAGIWDHWEGDGQRISSCSIIVTAANPYMAPLHDRMPAIIEPQDYERWLDPRQDGRQLLPLLVPYDKEDLIAYPVSTAVNDPKNDTVDLLKRI